MKILTATSLTDDLSFSGSGASIASTIQLKRIVSKIKYSKAVSIG